MKCKEVRKYFSKSIENKEILKHLENCGSCREEYKSYLALRNILSKGSVPEKDEFFWESYIDEIKNKLKNIPQKEKVKIIEKIKLPVFLRQPVYAAAAVVILLTGIFTFYRWTDNGKDVDIYSNSLVFFLEEFENVEYENVFTESVPFDEEDLRFYINYQPDAKNE